MQHVAHLGSDPETAEYKGRLTYSLFHEGQEVTLTYAHKKPSESDVRGMIALLRKFANYIETDYGRAMIEKFR